MNATLIRSPRRLAAGLLVLVALGVAACGSNSSSSSSSTKSSTQSSQPASSSGGAATTTTSGSSSNGIPQGPNAGDADADNHGGPSDGDGNI
jgi:ABC-type phosphate transport system substrate-binding protein